MVGIGGVPSRAQAWRVEQNAEPAVKPAQEGDDDATPAALLQKFVENSDEMAASLRSQFRRRGDFGDKFESMSDNFERVLDEDVLPKARQVLSLATLADKSVEWLLIQARKQFPDDSDLVLVLRELLRQKQMAQATRQRLEKMLEQVLSESPPKFLKAGINTALKAKLFGKALALKAAFLRATYRSFLEAEGSPIAFYEDLIALYGYQQRNPLLEFIEAAVLTDIDAQDPSCSRREFGQLLKKLGDLKRLRSVEVDFIRHLLANEVVSLHNANEPDWLMFLLGLFQAHEELPQLLLAVLGEQLLLVEHRERGQVLHALRLASLRLPAELFEDDEALGSIADQFTQLTDRVFAHETIEKHTAMASRFIS